jgi:MFS transporter, DHA2 family, multidrug resistance protein
VERFGTKAVVTAGCTCLATLPATGCYPHLVIEMLAISGGMGLIMAPATESVMGSVPRSKAGVGSAMNDTTRQMGGAIGVAVIGSLVLTAYRPGVVNRLRNLGTPTDVISAARQSLGQGPDAAAGLPQSRRQSVTSALRVDFVNAQTVGMLVPAGCWCSPR